MTGNLTASNRSHLFNRTQESDQLIHPNDFMFRFIESDPSLLDKSKAISTYLDDGAQTVLLFKKLLSELPPQPERYSLLEFASGYGRLTRHFPKLLPNADVVACDVHEQAVDFILNKLGCKAIMSSHNPEAFNTGQQFHIVFALSFFTHIPKHRWRPWLNSLQLQTAPTGLLIFTTHGRQSLRYMGVSELDPDGFWFAPFSEQKDLDTSEYGATATSFDFVYRQFADTELKLIRYQEAGMGHQDVYALRRGD